MSPAASASSPRFRTWPITATSSLEPTLRDMGLRMPAGEIDGTSSDSACLSDALVSVGAAGRGGTGSFVSESGLIITNWHVAHEAVRQVSLTKGTDYLETGFVARSFEEELPSGPAYECWITTACTDVSSRVVEVLTAHSDPLKRSNAMRDCCQSIAAEAQEAAGKDGIRCDVQEMLPNESYVLFTYERIMDVRIVYVPPKSLGNFGGDTDNFEWPRHTADFTLLRAYVGPDGTPAAYSPDNVPYTPRASIRVNADGAAEGDFVFLLGFPGSTMRYAPACRLRYSDEVAVPAMVKDFGRKLQLIAEHETASKEAALKLNGGKKSLANEHKRSGGKLVVMRKLGLLEQRLAEEAELCKAVPEAAPTLKRLSEIYEELRKGDAVSNALQAMRGIYFGSALLAAGHHIHEFLQESQKPDSARESAYRARNISFLVQRLSKRLSDVHEPFEWAVINDALEAALSIPSLREGAGAGGLVTADPAVVKTSLSLLSANLEPVMLHGADASVLSDDPFVSTAASLYASYESDRDSTKALLSERDTLFAKLLELQRLNSTETFYPDCNGSLRLSAGHVKGYFAADAVEHHPRTTLGGLFDKAADARAGGGSNPSEFVSPERLYTLLQDSPPVRDVPVNVLYSTDTVGGNSGSPVMNAKGEFVAINFDRQRLGLMNEFAWSAEYSRSIGVDSRFVLWLVGEYDSAQTLVDEMTKRSTDGE